jgi:hypothetical protein
MAVAVAVPVGVASTAQAGTAPRPATSAITPYPGGFVDLYANPGGAIDGSTYIFNPTADFTDRMAFDFRHMKTVDNVNTIGFYNLVQMSDADRDAIFTNLESNRQKAVVRIENYDGSTFDFDNNDPTHADANSVVSYYNRDDTAHGYTALFDYLIRKNRLADIAYFAVNMPVDDGTVASHFQTAQYPDPRTNPAWSTSQVAYADYLIGRLRGVLGSAAKLYLSVFYGWDYSYPTPSYANVAHPADGYFFNNYSYPASTPPDADADPSRLINQPRLQEGMDKLMAQYPTQPVVIEYGFHTVEYNQGGIPGQTAGLVNTLAAKVRALTTTTDYYRTGSSAGRHFNVRGSLYFAQNLYKEEGVPASVDDWTLDYPNTGQVEAENTATVEYADNGRTVADLSTVDSTASGGRSVPLRERQSLTVIDESATSVVQIRYRSPAGTTLAVSVNGATPQQVPLGPSTGWSTATINVTLPVQGDLKLARGTGTGDVTIDWVATHANYEAELGTTGTAPRYADQLASGGAGVVLAGAGRWVGFIHGVSAGTRLRLRYAARPVAQVLVQVGDTAQTRVSLPATGGDSTYAEVTVPVRVPAGTRIRVTGTNTPVRLDYLGVEGRYEAESTGGLYNGGHAVASRFASGGAYATDFDVVGASDVFSEVGPATTLTLRYSATRDASLTIIVNGNLYPLKFPSTRGANRFATVRLNLVIGPQTTIIAQRGVGDQAIGLRLDYLDLS